MRIYPSFFLVARWQTCMHYSEISLVDGDFAPGDAARFSSFSSLHSQSKNSKSLLLAKSTFQFLPSTLIPSAFFHAYVQSSDLHSWKVANHSDVLMIIIHTYRFKRHNCTSFYVKMSSHMLSSTVQISDSTRKWLYRAWLGLSVPANLLFKDQIPLPTSILLTEAFQLGLLYHHICKQLQYTRLTNSQKQWRLPCQRWSTLLSGHVNAPFERDQSAALRDISLYFHHVSKALHFISNICRASGLWQVLYYQSVTAFGRHSLTRSLFLLTGSCLGQFLSLTADRIFILFLFMVR